MPESAYGPTNNCIGIGDVLRQRGHRVVFAAEASWKGKLTALGFEEDLVDLAAARRRRRAGRRPVLEGLHPRHRAGVPQAHDRAAGDLDQAGLAGADRRREVLRSRSCGTIIARVQPGRDRRGQRGRVPGADHRRRAVRADRVVQPAGGARATASRRCSPAIRPTTDREWDAFRAEYDRTHREMWAGVQRVGRDAGRAGRCRTWSSSTRATSTCTSTRRSPTTPTPARSARQWHRLDSSVRETDGAFELPASTGRRRGRADLLLASARSARPTSS